MRFNAESSRGVAPSACELAGLTLPQVCQGTNAISCENSVMPTFMRHTGSLKSESIANVRNKIQIVDTREASGTRINIEAAIDRGQLDRTLLILPNGSKVQMGNNCWRVRKIRQCAASRFWWITSPAPT